MGQAGPALIVAMPTPVTPCGDIPHPTVLDPWVPTDHPAAGGGDVGGTDEIPVAAEPANRCWERSGDLSMSTTANSPDLPLEVRNAIRGCHGLCSQGYVGQDDRDL